MRFSEALVERAPVVFFRRAADLETISYVSRAAVGRRLLRATRHSTTTAAAVSATTNAIRKNAATNPL